MAAILDKFETLVLKNASTELILRPALGGAIQTLSVNGRDVLRSAIPYEADVTKMASFPMVPVVNRIPNGKFEFEGRSVQLEANLFGTEDFIHGYGWKSQWTIDKHEKSNAVLRFVHSPGDWPWAFEAIQEFRLEEKGIWTELSVTNTSNTNMPAALGFHPYFPIAAHSRLKAQYEGHWESNEKQHALRRISGSTRKDFTVGANFVDTKYLDVSHYNWQGAAIIAEKGRPTIKLTASRKANHLHVYYPPCGNFVAIEPTSGRSNMFAVLPRDYEILEPGQTFSIWMRIEVEQGSEK